MDFVFGHFWGHCLTKMAPCGPKNQFWEGFGSMLKISLKTGDARKRKEARGSARKREGERGSARKREEVTAQYSEAPWGGTCARRRGWRSSRAPRRQWCRDTLRSIRGRRSLVMRNCLMSTYAKCISYYMVEFHQLHREALHICSRLDEPMLSYAYL